MVAVQGVSSELVSHEIPCYAGKIQGIFAKQACFGPQVPCKLLNLLLFPDKFPTRRNREFNRCIRELAGNSCTPRTSDRVDAAVVGVFSGSARPAAGASPSFRNTWQPVPDQADAEGLREAG